MPAPHLPLGTNNTSEVNMRGETLPLGPLIAKRALFLDFDGVVTEGINSADGSPRFSRSAVARLNQICAASGCAVVVTSTWRLYSAKELIEKRLTEAGFSGKFHEDWRTPDLPSGRRGAEVEQWLAAHPEVEAWAALDDDRDFSPSQPLVRTDPKRGLGDLEVREALRILLA